ncbi:MAG: TetR/AcrR family transcriptional regulator [Roseburia sp.]
MQAAWELFRKKGYRETEAADIIARAKVTEEEFYRYFSGKDDLEHTLGELFDEKYAQLMVSMNPRFSQFEKLVFLNRELFLLVEDQVPFELISHIYVDKPTEQQKLLDKNRFYYKLIRQIISEGQETGEFKKEQTAESIADTYASLERGIIYDWCVQGGKESLMMKGQMIIPIFLEHLLMR